MTRYLHHDTYRNTPEPWVTCEQGFGAANSYLATKTRILMGLSSVVAGGPAKLLLPCFYKRKIETNWLISNGEAWKCARPWTLRASCCRLVDFGV